MNQVISDPVTMEQKRRKVMLCAAAVVLVAVLIVFVIGLLREPAPKTFTTAGMQITLTDAFKESKPKNFTMCYGAKEMAVYTLKEAFSLSEGLEENTLQEYTARLLAANELSSDIEIVEENGLCYFERSFTNSKGVTYHYFCFSFKAPDAFWSIQFAVHEEDTEALRDTVFSYANSVTFPQ